MLGMGMTRKNVVQIGSWLVAEPWTEPCTEPSREVHSWNEPVCAVCGPANPIERASSPFKQYLQEAWKTSEWRGAASSLLLSCLGLSCAIPSKFKGIAEDSMKNSYVVQRHSLPCSSFGLSSAVLLKFKGMLKTAWKRGTWQGDAPSPCSCFYSFHGE